MRLIRACALALPLALGALGAALPVQADSGVTVTATPRWGVSSPGSWIPYEVVVRNDGATSFEGDVVLAPAGAPFQQGNGYVPNDQFPHYSKHVTVASLSQQKVEIMVFDASFGYSAEVRDASGNTVAKATAASQSSNPVAYTVGVLSDAPGADIVIQGAASLPSGVIATRFNGATDFPASALDLTGLQTIVIDDFDSASLSHAQMGALTDFVGLGGNLVIAGGASWRRTLLPLPPELVPLRPTNTQEESLQPLADLAGQKSSVTAAISTGDLAGGKSALEGPDHLPMVVEGSYGSGHIVLLAFDPLADPVASNGALSELAWAQGLARTVAGTTAIQLYPGKVFVPPGAAVGAPGGVSFGPNGPVQSFADAFSNVISQSPDATTPPVLLLGLILLAYVALTGPIAYLVLRSMRRRELLWATAPIGALIFTMASYGIGFGSHGSDFVDNAIELQRISPSGTMQAYTYQGLFAPQRGDHVISLPPATIATTSFGSNNGGNGSSRNSASDLVVVGGRTTMNLHGVAVWQPNSFQTVSLQAGSTGLEVHLSYSNGGLRGTIVNRTVAPIRDLRVVVGSNLAEVNVAAGLQAGQSMTVGPIPIPPSSQSSPSAIQMNGGCPDTFTQTGREDCVLTYAAGLGAYTPGQLYLVGLVDAIVPITVDGAKPHRSTIAALIEPVSLESSDSLVAGLGTSRLVSVYRSTPNFLDVYDIDLSSQPQKAYTLKYVVIANPTGQQSIAPEVYDWSTGTWRALPLSANGQSRLQPDEVSHGAARVRLAESSPGLSSSFLSVVQV
jgi:hypothetical protein